MHGIAKRTLIGFRKAKASARYFEGLINKIKIKPGHFIRQVDKFITERTGIKNVKINAIVGNPPYQEVVTKKETANGQKRSSSIFQHFQTISDRREAALKCVKSKIARASLGTNIITFLFGHKVCNRYVTEQ